jgi:hypothetical protein
MYDDLGVCPSYFNDVRTVGSIYPKKGEPPTVFDPYHLNDGIPVEDQIPAE